MKHRELAENLIAKLKNPVKLCALWEWKADFYRLPESFYQEYPILSSAMTQIKIMEGNLEEAWRYLEYTKKDQRIYNYTKLLMPDLEPHQLVDVLYQIVAYGGGVTPNLTLSASRPTILNGLKDFSKYGKYITENKEEILTILRAVYGDAAEGVYEIALAEHLYQQDKCFEALVLAVGTIPFMENKKDLRCLLATMTLEMYILVMNGQASSAAPLMNNIRKRVEQTGSEELRDNVDALEVHAAMYDGQMDKVSEWLKDKAPDEYADFNMLDNYRYVIKLRCYLIYEKHMALYSLASRLKPLLEKSRRIMDLCDVQMIEAMSNYVQGKKEEAFNVIEKVLEIAEKYQYDRLIGDEGALMYQLLRAYKKERGTTAYLERVTGLAGKIAGMYPNYLRLQHIDVPKVSVSELQVLRLMADEKSNGEIAEYLNVTLNTVKFHSKNIFKKLQVRSRGQAVKRAREVGIL